MICATDVLLDFSSAFPVHGSDLAAIDRRMHRHFAVLVQGRVYTKTIKQCGNHGSLLKRKTQRVQPEKSRLIRPVVLAPRRLPNKRPLREISFRLFMLRIAGKKETRKRTTHAE
jgi:hypothetical protein